MRKELHFYTCETKVSCAPKVPYYVLQLTKAVDTESKPLCTTEYLNIYSRVMIYDLEIVDL
jgi:hypothetical protein